MNKPKLSARSKLIVSLATNNREDKNEDILNAKEKGNLQKLVFNPLENNAAGNKKTPGTVVDPVGVYELGTD